MPVKRNSIVAMDEDGHCCYYSLMFPVAACVEWCISLFLFLF